MLRALLPVALLFTGALTLAPQDAVPAAPAGLRTSATVVHVMVGHELSETVGISIIFSLSDEYIDPESGKRVRLHSSSSLMSAMQVVMERGESFGPVDVDSREPLVTLMGPANTGVARGLAGGLLGETDVDALEALQNSGEEVPAYELTVSPREGLTWGDAKTRDDLVFAIEPAPEGG